MEQVACACLWALHRCSSFIRHTYSHTRTVHTHSEAYVYMHALQLTWVWGHAYISMIDREIHCYPLLLHGKIKPHCVSWCKPGYNQPLSHNKAASRRKPGKEQNEGGAGHGEVSAFFFVGAFLHLKSVCLCVEHESEKGKGGLTCTGRKVWALPHSIWHNAPPPIMHAGSICISLR